MVRGYGVDGKREVRVMRWDSSETRGGCIARKTKWDRAQKERQENRCLHAPLVRRVTPLYIHPYTHDTRVTDRRFPSDIVKSPRILARRGSICINKLYSISILSFGYVVYTRVAIRTPPCGTRWRGRKKKGGERISERISTQPSFFCHSAPTPREQPRVFMRHFELLLFSLPTDQTRIFITTGPSWNILYYGI